MRLSLRDRSWLAPAGLAAIAFASLPALVMGQEAGKQVKPTTADKPYDFTWGWKVVDQPVEIDHRQKNLGELGMLELMMTDIPRPVRHAN